MDVYIGFGNGQIIVLGRSRPSEKTDLDPTLETTGIHICIRPYKIHQYKGQNIF